MPTSSAILNVQLIFDSYFVWMCFGSSSIFASSVSKARKKSQGARSGEYGRCGNIIVYFLIKNSHTSNDVNRGVIVQKPIFVLPQIRTFLADCFAKIPHILQVIFLIDCSTLKI